MRETMSIADWIEGMAPSGRYTFSKAVTSSTFIRTHFRQTGSWPCNDSLLSPRLTFGPQSAWEIERKMLVDEGWKKRVNLESFKIKRAGFRGWKNLLFATNFRRLWQSRFFPSTRDIDDLVTSDAILSDSFVTEYVTECPILSQLRQIALVTYW